MKMHKKKRIRISQINPNIKSKEREQIYINVNTIIKYILKIIIVNKYKNFKIEQIKLNIVYKEFNIRLHISSQIYK